MMQRKLHLYESMYYQWRNKALGNPEGRGRRCQRHYRSAITPQQRKQRVYWRIPCENMLWSANRKRSLMTPNYSIRTARVFGNLTEQITLHRLPMLTATSSIVRTIRRKKRSRFQQNGIGYEKKTKTRKPKLPKILQIARHLLLPAMQLRLPAPLPPLLPL